MSDELVDTLKTKMKTIARVKDVSKKYGDIYALKDLSLEINEGDFVSVMGPSGSGKTTLLNLISCLDKPSTGAVEIDGVDIAKATSSELNQIRREKVGLIFQQYHLVPYLSALENVMLAQHYHSIPNVKSATRALEEVGLAERLTHLPGQLSGGEQQRVCIARALINQPKLILADEPTGNLDQENEKLVVDLLKKMSESGHTLVIVTHNPAIGDLAGRKITLEHGQII